MKRIPWPYLVLIALLSFSAFSCDPICGCEPPLPPAGKMEAYFDVNGWLSTSAKAVISDGGIALTGRKESTIQFFIEGSSAGNFEGTVFYTPAAANIDSASYSSAYSDWKGGINIIEVDTKKKTITGRFETFVTNGREGFNMHGAFNQIPYVAAPYNTFNGKVNDSDFASVIIGVKANGDKIDVNFFKENGETINLSIPSSISAGDYEMDETYKAAYISAIAESYKAVAGSMTIIENDHALRRISGTFNFEGDPIHSEDVNVIITNAAFTVNY